MFRFLFASISQYSNRFFMALTLERKCHTRSCHVILLFFFFLILFLIRTAVMHLTYLYVETRVCLSRGLAVVTYLDETEP
jgi:hypothetical protein